MGGSDDASGAGAVPRRPMLAEHALPRRHVADGEESVVIHDARGGASTRVGAREWGLLACADGTRDLDGVVLAAANAGVRVSRASALEFFEALAAQGLLVEGDDVVITEQPPPRPTPDDRPLDPLAGYAFACDGTGVCCRQYGSVIFYPVEAVRARGLLPAVREAGVTHGRAFTPLRGSRDREAFAVAMVDGACAYLDPRGLCSIHAAAGAAAKPIGCQLFPATFADDGEAVRVSVAPECACVLASAGRAAGDPLVPASARVRGDLGPGPAVDVVRDPVALGPGRTAPRRDVVAWARAVVARASDAPPPDVARAFWALAAAVDRAGVDPGAARDALATEAAPDAGEVLGWIAALAERAVTQAYEDAGWRSAKDRARRGVRWVADASLALVAPGELERAIAASSAYAAGERLYLRAVVHGYQVVGRLPLASALRDRAVRVWVARELPAAASRSDLAPDAIDASSLAQPLALVEAMLRAHGLASYAWDAAPSE